MDTGPKVKKSCVKCGAVAGELCNGPFQEGMLLTEKRMTEYDESDGCAIDDIPF